MKYWNVGICWLFWSLAAFAAPLAPAIIPLPQLVQPTNGTFTLCASQINPGIPARATTPILADAPSLTNAQYLAVLLLKATGFQFPVQTNSGSNAVKGAILLTTVNGKNTLGAEGYELTVSPDAVVIRAPTGAGVFYGIQSFLQLLPAQIFSQQPVGGVAWTAPCVYVQDQPRFPWRGFMMDAARHFFNKQEVKQFLDVMALHKLNTFHWHLVDDQGWRLEIKAYPLLTQTGGFRPGIDFGQNPRASTAYNTNGQYGGYYTQDDVREIVAYAQQRYITIVPEIEMPAHCTSGLISYPQFGCGNAASSYNMDTINYKVSLYSLAGPGSMAFLEQILTEVMALFPGQYIHCGGDEVVATTDHQWSTYAPDKAQMQALGITPNTSSASAIAYQHWFSTNLSAFIQSKGRTMGGWTEFENGGIVPNALLTDWETGNSSKAIAAAEAGQPVVMTPDTFTYCNYYMINNTVVEPYFEVGNQPAFLLLSDLYNFEPVPAGLPAQYDSQILGSETSAFAEFIPSFKNLEFKALPRMAALAELTWTQAAQKDFTNFSKRLVGLEQRYAAMGANYDRTNIQQIGTWPAVPTNATTVTYDITPYVKGPGELDVAFNYTGGNDGLWIYSASLLVNGVAVDTNVYTGFAGLSFTALPYYVLNLATFKPGATYTIQASVAGRGGTDTAGVVYLPNWN